MKKSIIDRAVKLNNKLKQDTVLLEPREFMDAAVIRYRRTKKGYHLVYGFDELIQAFMKQGMNEEEAVEWIGYNTERGIPYMASEGVEPKIAYRKME